MWKGCERNKNFNLNFNRMIPENIASEAASNLMETESICRSDFRRQRGTV